MASKFKERIKLTGFRSLVYRSGYVYNWMTKRLFDQKKKFVSISKIIENSNGNGSDIKVLDIPCGCGYLTRFLPKNIEYEGWDLNHRFLKKLKKDWLRGKVQLKKLTLKQKNIFDFDDYPEEVDIIILCDILHHIYPKHLELVENAKQHAKKVIICEPIAVKPQDINARDKFFNSVLFFGKFLPEPLIKLVDFIFFDNDGINSYDDRSEWKHDEQSLMDLYESIGIENNRIYNIMVDYIGVWEA